MYKGDVCLVGEKPDKELPGIVGGRVEAEDGSGQDWMGGYTRWPEAYLVTLADRCSFLCVSGQRGTIAKSMHEEHLCVVALTSMERGTQFFPLASYRLV